MSHRNGIFLFWSSRTQVQYHSHTLNNSNDKKHVKPSTMASKASLLRLVRLPKMYIQQNKLLLIVSVYDSEYL